MLRLVSTLTLMVIAGTTAHSEPAPVQPGPPPASASELIPLPPASSEKAAAAAAVVTPEPVLVESCDGSRLRPTKDPQLLTCRRWSIAWQEGGTPWGLVTADSYDGVLVERERQLGFARQYARFFEVPLDDRYTEPSPPICETCSNEAPAGRWGEGQKFSDTAARQALATAREQLAGLDVALVEHMPRLTDAARLAQRAATSKAARAYAKELRLAVLQLAKVRLALENAAVLRSEQVAKDAAKVATAQVEALASKLTALRTAVSKEVAKAHAGRYFEEGTTGADRPHLEIEIDGTDVKGTYFTGGAQSTWFEGTVELDGSLSGRSLLAPEKGALSCQQHAESCGYVYIPSVLRFTERPTPEGKTIATAELWFQRSTWVMAKPFTR